MNLRVKLVAWLIPERRRYAAFAGGCLWIAWLTSILTGHGAFDRVGQVIGADYLQFHAAGKTLLDGQSARLYDFDFQKSLQQQIVGEPLRDHYAFITPPMFAWVFEPLARLPYLASFTVWSLASIAGLFVSVKLLDAKRPIMAALWSLTWFPVFASVSFGQNGLLSLLILSLSYFAWRQDRFILSGLIGSLLLYKPQMALGLILLWLVNCRRQWPALVGFAIGAAAMAAACFAFLPQASEAYVVFSRTVLPDVAGWRNFPIWHLHTVRGFFRILLGRNQLTIADALYLFTSAALVYFALRFVRRHSQQREPQFSAAILLTIAVSPHAFIYDWSILLIPAILLWRSFPSQRDILLLTFAALWLAAFISGPLTLVQLKFSPIALQISVPVYLACLVMLAREPWTREAREASA